MIATIPDEMTELRYNFNPQIPLWMVIYASKVFIFRSNPFFELDVHTTRGHPCGPLNTATLILDRSYSLQGDCYLKAAEGLAVDLARLEILVVVVVSIVPFEGGDTGPFALSCIGKNVTYFFIHFP